MKRRVSLLLLAVTFVFITRATAQDARVGLHGGMTDAASAARGLVLVSNTPRPAAFAPGTGPALPPGAPPVFTDILYANSDMTFRGNLLFMGNFRGFQIYDIANASAPRLVATQLCPGGQGDLSTYGNLLFMSVEMPNGRVNCSDVPFSMDESPDRFIGVRIFDISDVAHPRQVASVQTCRGSHTHTLVTDPNDKDNVYLYVSGVDVPRPASELAGCSALPPDKDPNTSYFRIDIIKVPVNAPQNAAIVSSPRIFADSAGNIAGLFAGSEDSAHATARTDQCHDITVYPWAGLAAGACAGNGILLDVSKPANPRRIDQAVDPNFAYWHSATFNNDASKVIFTDEWGGGMAPRCQANDRKEWGADAIFTLNNRKLKMAGYYKLPAPQTAMENCVAHNGSLIPVPGRDIMVQAWYQGGVSAFDFTDPDHPFEIAYFDRGPVDSTRMAGAGTWSAYWYNGHIISSEILRGLDVFELTPSAYISQNELDAARTVHYDYFNTQGQPEIVWPPSVALAGAYADQLERSKGLSAARLSQVRQALAAASTQRSALGSLASQLDADARTSGDAAKVQLLAKALRDLAASS